MNIIKTKRTISMTVLVSDEEHRVITEAATKERKSFAAFVRDAAFDKITK